MGLDPAGIIKLASNENALGSAPAARRALATAAADLSRYPDMDCLELREGLSNHLGVPFEQIIVGAGSSELIVLAAQAFLAPGRSLVQSQFSFISYAGAAKAVGARAVSVPVKGWQPDLDGMLAAIGPDVHVVFIASPNNPTGTLVEARALERFIAAVPERVLVVLDEAYRDFVEPELRPNSNELVKKHPNLLVMRTFSKVYGLAALRVGYGLGNARLVSLLRRLQPPFSVSAPAQAAALAALSDTDFVKRSITANREGRARLGQELAAARFEFVPSYGNFLLIRVGNGVAVYRDLMRRGIVVRPLASYKLDEWVRVTVGLPEESAAFMRGLTELLPKGTPSG
jgi:histidinol-phosphate aminotransferase